MFFVILDRVSAPLHVVWLHDRLHKLDRLGTVRGYQIDHGQLFSYVLNGRVVGIANPFWAFYGGPMHTAVGALSDILGHNVILAFDILGLAAWSSAYGGMFWIGRICGLSKADSHFPAICVTTSAYWISDLYGRGDWMEFVAISSIPMVIASALAILRSRRFTFWPTGAFCASFFFFTVAATTSHCSGVSPLSQWLGACFGSSTARWRVAPKAVVRLSGLALLVACMNAWYLVPAVLFGPQTQIYHYARVPIAREMAPFDRMSVVFNPLRVVPAQHISQLKALFVQAPVWFLGRVVVATIFAATRRDSRRGALECVGDCLRAYCHSCRRWPERRPSPRPVGWPSCTRSVCPVIRCSSPPPS